MNRPKTTTAAAIVLFVLSATNGIGAIPFLMRGAATTDGPPFFVELVIFAAALVGLVSAYGVWRQQRWGALLSIIVCTMTGLVNLPGVLFAPGLFGKGVSAASLLTAIAVIVLLLWPKPRSAPASSQPLGQ